MYVRMALRLWVLIGWMARWPAGSLMPDDVAHGCHLACLVLQFGCLGLQKRILGNGSVAKKQLSHKLDFSSFQGYFFHDFVWLWEPLSWLLLPWRLAWKFMIFYGASGIISDPEPLVG